MTDIRIAVLHAERGELLGVIGIGRGDRRAGFHPVQGRTFATRGAVGGERNPRAHATADLGICQGVFPSVAWVRLAMCWVSPTVAARSGMPCMTVVPRLAAGSIFSLPTSISVRWLANPMTSAYPGPGHGWKRSSSRFAAASRRPIRVHRARQSGPTLESPVAQPTLARALPSPPPSALAKNQPGLPPS